ncbi:MAG: chromate transporter [Spirochaetales bacterium]|nr:chromate transporter [Spirochaetales bacterium]
MRRIWGYVELFGVFFFLGAFTFGGGLAMLPMLERELEHKRKWVTSSQLVDYYTIGQATPGIIAVNVATFVGYTRKGILGGIIATAGMVAPSLLIIMLLAAFLNNYAQIVWVQKALKGINVVVASLLVQAVWRLGTKTIKDYLTALIAIASFLAIILCNAPGVLVLTSSAVAGFILRIRVERRERS